MIVSSNNMASEDTKKIANHKFCDCQFFYIRIPPMDWGGGEKLLYTCKFDVTSKPASDSVYTIAMYTFFHEIQASMHDYLFKNATWYQSIIKKMYTVSKKSEVLVAAFAELQRIIDSKSDDWLYFTGRADAPVMIDAYGKPICISNPKVVDILLATMLSEYRAVLSHLNINDNHEMMFVFKQWPSDHIESMYPKIMCTNVGKSLLQLSADARYYKPPYRPQSKHPQPSPSYSLMTLDQQRRYKELLAVTFPGHNINEFRFETFTFEGEFEPLMIVYSRSK